jgi:hypothetical protein
MSDSITITDTGKRRTTSSSAEETDKANSGSALTLYGVEVNYQNEAILNTNPSLAKLSAGAATMFAIGETDHLGIKRPKWTIRGVLDDTSSSHMAVVKVLRDLPRTKGYKTLSGDLPDWMDGTDNASTVNVQVSNVNIQHYSAHNIINYTIEMFETE